MAKGQAGAPIFVIKTSYFQPNVKEKGFVSNMEKRYPIESHYQDESSISCIGLNE